MTPGEKEVRVALKLYGRVQGVGFRWWTVQQARRLGLRGTVRNCFDGSVEVVLAGTSDAVGRMADLLSVGPPGARVERLAQLTPPENIPDDFQIEF